MNLLLSQKYKDFLRHNAPVEFLEGTTAAGKTTVGAFKFMLQVAMSSKKMHILSGLDTGTIEKNIINKDLGICDIFGKLVEYKRGGGDKDSLPHLIYHTSSGDKIVYVLGYDNKARWKKALGGQYGCLYIDEINIANTEYVREAAMRCDYLIGTLNPDNPDLPVYKEYINKARPTDKYKNDGPKELLQMLNEKPNPNWVWWYFSFDHNLGIDADKKAKIIENVPVGTKIYKNKILGLRGKSTGIVFGNFDYKKHVVSREYAKGLIKSNMLVNQVEWFIAFSSGLDTAYSQKSEDTIAMSYIGITNKGRCITLDERVYNNKDMDTPIAPSDTAKNYVDFLKRNGDEWGYCRHVFVDSADQATITELGKYKRQTGAIWEFNNAYKKMKIVDRINTQRGWIAHGHFLVVETCENYIHELGVYSWKEDKDNEPEDANDHMINSVQYAFIPYKTKIGVKTNGTGG